MNFLYFIYSKTIGRKKIIFRMIRFFIRNIINIYAPIYLFFSKNSLSKEINVIVSLTSFPERIDKVWIVIKSILNQTVTPKKIILTLSKPQFDCKKLPNIILDFKNRGVLEIIWTNDDLRSHKKYYYVMKKYPNDIIVTIDDDIIYENRLLEFLWKYHIKFPTCIIANNACLRSGLDYSDWKNLNYKEHLPSNRIMPIGCGGVLYPPNSLPLEVFNKEKLKKCCPLADDIWLNSMTFLNKVKVVKTNYNMHYISISYSKRNNINLFEQNVFGDKNNQQLICLRNEYDELKSF